MELAAPAARSSEAARELERAREGYGAGVRAVFAEGATPVLAGVVGTVADLLEVAAGLERAVEAVLGERLQWVVVERFEHARAALGYLDASRRGRGDVPAARARCPRRRRDPTPRRRGLRWVARHVIGARRRACCTTCSAGWASSSISTRPRRLWRRNGVVATYVTPTGEVLSPTGRLRGGSREGGAAAEHSLLDAQAAAPRARATRSPGSTATWRAAAAPWPRSAAEVATLRAATAGLEQSVQAQQAERVAGEKDLEQSVREHERVQRHLETVGTESRQVDARGRRDGGQLAAAEQRIAVARERRGRATRRRWPPPARRSTPPRRPRPRWRPS